MQRASWLLGVLMLAVLVWTAAPARAADARPPVVIWPTLTPAGDAASAAPLHRPLATDKPLFDLAQQLDATLRDAVQDLGFTLYVADAGPSPGRTRDQDLLDRAASAAADGASRFATDEGTWVVSPRIESAGGGSYVVRIVAVPPKGRELRVRVETVQRDAVDVRGLVLLRDLLTPEAAAAASLEQERRDASKGTTQGVTAPVRSSGRAILAINAGIFGGFTGFSLEAAANGSTAQNDVLYPLLALGAGVGVGAALLVADEWDVSTGDAWFLSAGGLWPTLAGLFIADGKDVQPFASRYSWGITGGLVGLGLATSAFAITHASMDDGDAVVTHSGGALGMLVGASIQWLRQGTAFTSQPSTGMGYGAAAGVIGAGVLATQVTTSPSRVLLIDLGAGGGGLVGAAAGSPLIVENTTAGKTRAWISLTLAGSVAGGGLTWWLTGRHPHAGASLPGLPMAGILGMTPAPGTRSGEAPIYGVGWAGAL